VRPPRGSGLEHRSGEDRLTAAGFGQLKVTKLRGILLLPTTAQWENGEKPKADSSWRRTGAGQGMTKLGDMEFQLNIKGERHHKGGQTPDAYGISILLDTENAAGRGHKQPDAAGTALRQGLASPTLPSH